MALHAGIALQQGHVRIGLGGALHAAVRPFVVRAVGQVGDHGGVDTLLAHGSGQVVHDKRAIQLVVEGLDVVIDILQGSALVGDDHDAGLAGGLQSGFNGFQINGNHADGVHVLGYQVHDQLILQGGVDFRGALLVDRVFRMGSGVLLDAGVHTYKPGIGGILRHDDDLIAVSQCGDAGEQHQRCHDQSDNFLHGSILLFICVQPVRAKLQLTESDHHSSPRSWNRRSSFVSSVSG